MSINDMAGDWGERLRLRMEQEGSWVKTERGKTCENYHLHLTRYRLHGTQLPITPYKYNLTTVFAWCIIRENVRWTDCLERSSRMAYTTINFKTKKALKEAVKNGEKVTVYQPGPFGGETQNGTVYLEGPHYPAPHTWYASAVLKNGVVVSVK